jgi:DNA end-binding protein Ku
VGERPFVLLQQCLAEEELEAVCRGVLFSREELLLLRPVEKLLAVTVLKFEAEVASPDELGESVHELQLKKQEIELTKTLLEAYRQDDFSLGEFKDRYFEDLSKLIEAKVQGKEVVKPPAVEAPQVINLMDALKKSLAGKKPKAAAAGPRPGPRPSRRKPRRKSG